MNLHRGDQRGTNSVGRNYSPRRADAGSHGIRAGEALEGVLPRTKGGRGMTESKAFKSSLKIPKFATEAEEAKWWFENRDLLFKEFQKAAEEGRLGRGGVRRLFAERGIPFHEPQTAVSPTPTT